MVEWDWRARARRLTARGGQWSRLNVAIGTVACLIASLLCGMLFVASSAPTIPAPDRMLVRTISIQPTFPLYSQYYDYFVKQQGYLLTRSTSADVVIAQAIPGSYPHQQLIYNQVLVLTEDFKNLDSAISGAQFAQVIADRAHTAVEEGLARQFPVLPATADPLAFVQQDSSHYAVIPFEMLTNRYRTVDIDSNSPIRKTFDESTYPLKLAFTLAADVALPSQMARFVTQHAFSNYDKSQILSLIHI